MHFLPPSVLMTGTFCHFLTNCLPTVPSSGGIPSRPAFVPGGQFSADRSLFYKERVSAGPLFPVVVLFLCLRRVTFCRYWQKVTRRRQERGCWEKYAVGDKRGKNCRRVGYRQHTIDEQGQVRLPPMVTKGEENGAGILLPLIHESVISSSAHHRGCP